jgi:hypothetical protein
VGDLVEQEFESFEIFVVRTGDRQLVRSVRRVRTGPV